MSEQYSSDEDACVCNGEVGGGRVVVHKRKENHNEVERRRKDKININILRIGDLLPDKDPKKQSKNEILERASDYIIYLKDLNEKLVMDKVTNVEATVFAGLRKQIKELEDLNANYVRLLTTAGIPLTSGPEEIWDHKPKKYCLKQPPDKARALLASAEVKTILQPCQHHGGTVVPSRPAEPALPKMVQPVAAAVAPPPATAARDATPGCTLVTQALPSAPVMSTAQPSAAVTVFQQQHPLTAVTPTATGVATGAGGVVSQPILVFNDQGVPVLQNVVTFQNTSIILNPQGHTVGARAPGSMVSFAGPDMLPQMHLAGQSPDDFAHSAALGASLVHCDPKLKEAKLCGVQHNTAFLSSTGMVMNQPLLSLGAGATMIAGQTAPAPQVPSAFLLPSGQIIPVVSQPQVVSAPVAPAQPLGGQVAANVPTSSCAASYGKVVHCEPTQSYMCREHAAAMQSKAPATPASSSSGVAAATAGAQHGACKKQHHLCPQHSSPSSSKCVAVPDSSRAKPACSHTASKQQLCSIRPKPTSQTPDSSQAKPSCARKGGGKKVATRPSLETPAKKARTEGPRADDESATTQAPSSSSTTTAAVAQSTEGVSSTSNKELPPLAADILAQATESIFACGSVEATASQAVQSRGKSPASLNDRPPMAAAAATTAEAATLQATTVTTVASPPSASVALTQSQCSKTSTVAEAVCSSDNLPANSGIEEASSIKNDFQSGRPAQMDAETTSTSQPSVENGPESVPAAEQDDGMQASANDRGELPSLSLHSIVMEENIDISPSVSSTTFTESYVSVGPSSNGHNTPQGTAKIPDCAASILCQLTPPSSKGSEDNSKAFVSSTDSLTSDQELPLILSIPEDDGHGSLNSNSNPGLSFPSLSPGDQLEQELGNSSVKTTESTNSLSQFVLTPPTPHVPASNAQVSVTSSLSKKKDSPEGNTYAYVTSESFPASRNHSTDLHAAGNNSGSKQDCHHASRSPQLQSLPPAKLHTETSCHSFASNAPPALPMYTRGLQFSTAPAASTHSQTHHTSLPGFSTAQGFAAPKEPESLPSLNSGKPPPSPCRMVRDSGRCTTPSKSPSAQFSMSVNPYMTTTSFPLPRPEQYTACTSAPTPQSNTQSSTNTALSCYSAEALIGAQNFLPSSYRLTPPSCAQVPTTQRSSCQQSSRPQISYSAESLIQSQASNPKKDLQGGAKEPGFSNHPGFANRLPYQPQTSTPQHSIGQSHQRQLPTASTTHLGHLASTSVAGDSRSQALPMSTAVAPQAATVHSSYNSQRSLATTPSRYPVHPYHTGKEDFPMLPSAPLHTPPLHTMAPHVSQPSSRSHHMSAEASSNQNMFQHQNYPYPNFSLGHRSPSFSSCTTTRPDVPMTSRAPASCLQATSPRQSHFGMQVPTSQQQGCFFPSASAAPILPLTSEFGPQCSGTLAPPPPTMFGNLSQHCVQSPHLMNNLIPGTFATASSPICGAPLAPPLGTDHGEKQAGRREKQNMHPPSEAGCPEPEKQQPKSKSKKSKPSNTLHTTVASIPYFPDFRNESHNHHALITLPPPPAPSQKFSHPPSLTSTSTPSSSSSSSTTSWPHPQQQQQQQQHHQHHTHQALHSKHGGPEADRSASISSAAYNPLFRPQSQQNSINLNLNGSAPPTPHSSAPPFSHHHSPLQRNLQHSTAPTSSAASMPSMAAPSIPAAPPMAPYTNCAVAAPSQHVPNFNLSNIFPDIGSTDQGRAGAGAPPPPPSTHFYSSSRVLHNSFNHILPPPPPPPPTHNNFVHSGHHAPSFSNVIPPLTFPMHEH